MKIGKSLVIIISMLSFAVPSLAQQRQEGRVLKSGNSSLLIRNNGLHIIASDMKLASQDSEMIFWKLYLIDKNDFNRETVISSNINKPEIFPISSGYRVYYKSLNSEKGVLKISLCFDITTVDNGYSVKGYIENGESQLVATELYGPVTGGIKSNLYEYPLISPCGLGQIFIKEPSEKEPLDKVTFKGGLAWSKNSDDNLFEVDSHYPSRFATMQWSAFAGDHSGIYFGSHDNLHRSKHLIVGYNPKNNSLRFGFRHQFTCFFGEKESIPELFVSAYSGSWHRAADIYSNWYRNSVKMQDVPEWAKNSSGWMLTIMKQQNEEIMWNYDSLEELCKLSEERGLDVLGLFGWTAGGHDRFYPDYNPDPAMGGKDALVSVIEKIHKRGKHVIIYANGQLIDQNGTEYWPQTGKNISVVKRDGTIDFQKWHKYYDAPARFHGMACLGEDEWYERMLDLALQANDLGADGILYDQLAVTAPKFCYSANHGHSVPAVVYESDRYRLLERIASYMKSINKDFIIMTEGLSDAVLGSISYFHGYENGAYVPLISELNGRINKKVHSSVFPEMFKYTFPEVLTTYRNPAPVNNRLILNYATLFGLRSELESRYNADVKYLKENRKPVPEDYSNVISKPDIDLVTSEDPVAMRIYSKKVIDFQRSFSWILWRGKYLDTNGFIAKCEKDVLVRAYSADSRLCVVVWNTSSQDRNIELSVPGYLFEYASSPESGEISAGSPLPKESIRIYMWKKQK